MLISKALPHMQHLSKDKILAPLLETVQPYHLEMKSDVFNRLCASIMSQQLSVKVAKVIHDRFLALFDNTSPEPLQLADINHEQLRAIGLSNAKVSYIKNVAKYFIENDITDKTFADKTDERVIAMLTEIKGVGRWTVEMLLMLTLGREDVFAADDLGIQQTMIALYGLNSENKRLLKEQMMQISNAWIPYRTYACFYLWKYKDNKSKL
jgi:DNA-3-methyladenine glycosylase II